MTDFSNQTLVTLAKLPLSQRRYRNGSLYVHAVMEGASPVAIDIRYFVEGEGDLSPTRSGFRVPSIHLPLFQETIRSLDCGAPGGVMCWSTSQREFWVRYLSDEYGTGVDFRYYTRSACFEGWENRGIRLTIGDFSRLREELASVDVKGDVLDSAFQRRQGHFSQSRESDRRSAYVNPALMGIFGQDD